MTTFKLGDPVTWVSSSNGSRLRKTGKVVGVISPGSTPFRKGSSFQRGCVTGRLAPVYAKRTNGFSQKSLSDGGPRETRSYLVAATNGRVYWPRTVQRGAVRVGV